MKFLEVNRNVWNSYDTYVSYLWKSLVSWFSLTLVFALLDQLFKATFGITHSDNTFHRRMTLVIVIRIDGNNNDDDDDLFLRYGWRAESV